MTKLSFCLHGRKRAAKEPRGITETVCSMHQMIDCPRGSRNVAEPRPKPAALCAKVSWI